MSDDVHLLYEPTWPNFSLAEDLYAARDRGWRIEQKDRQTVCLTHRDCCGFAIVDETGTGWTSQNLRDALADLLEQGQLEDCFDRSGIIERKKP